MNFQPDEIEPEAILYVLGMLFTFLLILTGILIAGVTLGLLLKWGLLKWAI